ncbi:synaptotagmin-like protein 5 [Ostrea edulis]|uniref:synaptotagmin-like protein 5 n=1 Tax=Ostrea edulis TaxID=37623 RepID=UPI0024AFD054|nr:synaptotagmin-like protein 5 [Ostrea edulis]
MSIGLKYNYSTQSLDVTIMECRDLPVVDGKKQHSNPYVKSYVVVAEIKYGKRKTRVLPATTNPRFYELFRYYISKADMGGSALLVTVWHYNKYGRNFSIGEVTIPLADSRCGELCSKWYKIEQKDTHHTCFMI